MYAVKSQAVSLSGVDESNISNEMISQIDNFINTNIDNFNEFEIENEYHTIEDDDVNFLILKNCPVLEDSVIITNNLNTDDSHTVLAACYHVDLKTGVINLLSDKSFTETTAIGFFTKGIHSVSVDYSYGYDNVPDDIKSFANLLLAKWAVIKDNQSDADGNLKSVKIGNYTEMYDLKFMNVASEYDDKIIKTYSSLKAKYFKSI